MVSADNDPRRPGTVWALNIDDPVPEIRPLVPATVRRVGPGDVPALAAAMGAGSQSEIARRLEAGRRCYAAWVEGQLAAYGWVSFDQEDIGELNLRLRLLPGEAYIWNCATLPAFRRRRLYSALLVHMVGELRTERVCRVWIGADLDNAASQRGIARAGFRPVADLVVARVLAVRLVWVQGRPDAPASLVAEARRAFLNNRDHAWLAALSSARQS
jgi:GNAT superfamily N-acetyltransferase